jgi:hypothetical protein
MAWAAVAGAAVSVAGGMLSGSKARKAQKQQDMRKQESAEAMLKHSQEYGNQQIGMANEYQKYAMGPSQSTNGFGTSTIDPMTGQTRFELNGQYNGLKTPMLGGASKAFDLAGNFDPKAHAKERYDASQALLAAGDSGANQDFMQQLYNKGGFGVTTNQTSAPIVGPNGEITQGTGTVGVNPLVNTFMNARNTRNANLSWQSLEQGESYLDRLLARGQGMFKNGAAIDEFGRTSMNDAMHYRNQFNGDMRDVLKMRGAGYDTHYKGVGDKYAAWAGQDPGFGNNIQSQQWAAGGNQLGGMIGKLDFNKMFGSGGDMAKNGLFQNSYGFATPDMN